MTREYDPHEIFRTQTEALAFLHKQGLKISKAKLSADYRKGLVPCGSDKSFVASDLMQYAETTLRAPTPAQQKTKATVVAPTPSQQKKDERVLRIALAQRELEGLATGIILDGKVVHHEAEFLLQWLIKNEELAKSTPPVRQLRNRLAKMLADDVLNRKEADKLLVLIHKLIIPHVPKYGVAKSVAHTCEYIEPRADIFNDITQIEFSGKHFCFTGLFAFGERQDCEEHTQAVGGIIHKTCLTSTDYVVVGSLASPDWKFGNYGRKVEQARSNRSNYGKPLIVHEDVWAEALCVIE